MIIEYALHDLAENDIYTRTQIETASKFPISSISIYLPHIKLTSSVINNDNILINANIDYPYGQMDTENRLEIVSKAIDGGAKIITLACQWYYAVNRKYDKIRKDVEAILDLCSKNKVELRYTLEYRVFSYPLMQKISKILLEKNINTIYVSSGQYLDNIYDNLIATAMINKKVSDINIICTGNIWTTEHAELLKKNKIYGHRANSIHSLELLS